MAAATPCAPCAARVMRLGEETLNILPVKDTVNRPAIVFGRHRIAETDAKTALRCAGLSLMTARTKDDLLHQIGLEKPDLVVVFGSKDGHESASLLTDINASRTTEKMPVLFISDARIQSAGTHANFDRVSPDSGVFEMFLAVRALLRRERPWILQEARAYGALQLDEARFRLVYGHETAALGKLDLNILGPFFDAPGHVFDRRTLQRLAYGYGRWKKGSRLIDAGVCRTRGLLMEHLGFDPIQTVRGVGYRLIGRPA